MTTPAPEPTVDENPDLGNEVGGADAVAERVTPDPVTPDPPFSAQADEDVVPDQIQEPEDPDTEANIEDPSTEPSA